MSGPLHSFFAADHGRLDGLLREAIRDPSHVALEPFGEFRAGILKHIGMEEKVLFVAARRARGEALPLVARLRVDHGAIASLLVPTPTPEIVAEIVSVVGPHNRREEDLGGAYDGCDDAVVPADAERLLRQLRRFPEIPLKPYNDAPAVFRHIEFNLDLARRQWL